MGSSDFFSYQWNIPFRPVVVNILEENINWIEHTYQKIGNQIEINPLGYIHLGGDKALAVIHVKNKGLSDLVPKSYNVKIHGAKILSDNEHDFAIKCLYRRGTQIETIPI